MEKFGGETGSSPEFQLRDGLDRDDFIKAYAEANPDDKEGIQELIDYRRKNEGDTGNIDADSLGEKNLPGEISEIDSDEKAERFENLRATFDSENWANLTEGQKLDACMELRDYLKDDLGMESGLNIEFVDDLDKNVGGTTEKTETDGTQIKINMDDLDDPEKIAEIISHESFHAYQHEQVDKIDSLPQNDEARFKAEGWKNDFETQTGDPNKDKSLTVEQDAYAYASNFKSKLFE